MNRSLSGRQCMERHYLQMEYHVQRPGGEKHIIEAQPTEALGLHCEGNGKPQRFLSRRGTCD